MALLAIEGFDDNLAIERYTAPGAVSTTYGYNSTKGMLVGDVSDDYLYFPVSTMTSDTTITLGFRCQLKDDGATTGGRYYVAGFIYTSTTMHTYFECVLMVNPTTRAWAVRDRTGYTDGVAGSAQLDTWYYIELQYTSASSPSGSWELRIDGVTTLTGTSRATYVTDNIVAMVGGPGSYDIDAMWIDDVYLLDSTGSYNNDLLGICAVETDLPSGNGNSSDLVGSDSNSTDNYLLVDNNASAPPATTEYVGSDTEGDKDTYAMSDLTTTGTVYGVQTTIYAQKDDSGAKFVRPVIRSGTTDYPGTSVAMSDSAYIPIDECWDADPDTSSAWTYTGVNAIEVGPEVRDS